MQISPNLHEMPILFYRKNMKKYFRLSSAEIFTQHAKNYIKAVILTYFSLETPQR